jgi:hypothetical protein
MTDKWHVNRIKVGRRFRKALGDLRSLAESIQEVGLLHPVVVTPRGRLIAGRRRLEAAKLLGWRSVPVHVVDLENVVEGELAQPRLKPFPQAHSKNAPAAGFFTTGCHSALGE